MTLFKLLLVAPLVCLTAIPIFSQAVTDELLRQFHKEAARQMEEQLNDDTADIDGSGWDEYYRTSEQQGRPASGFDPNAPKPSGKRVGCICMDGVRQDKGGRGACSGHGGVRYWIYQVTEDSTALYPTDNHWEHPEPLDNQERMSLAAYNEEGSDNPPGRGFRIGWGETLLGLMVCVTIAYIAKLWFTNHGGNHDQLLP